MMGTATDHDAVLPSELQFEGLGKYVTYVSDLPGDLQVKFTFANGHGASVVRNSISYGHRDGLFELAVLDSRGRLDYPTPITDNVLGYLTPGSVARALLAIKALPAVEDAS